MEVLKYDTLEPNKKQFLLDMLGLTMAENFEIGKRLKEQSDLLGDLSRIAMEVGDIKQHTRGQVFDLAEKMNVKMDINAKHKEFSMMRFYGEDRYERLRK